MINTITSSKRALSRRISPKESAMANRRVLDEYRRVGVRNFGVDAIMRNQRPMESEINIDKTMTRESEHNVKLKVN